MRIFPDTHIYIYIYLVLMTSFCMIWIVHRKIICNCHIHIFMISIRQMSCKSLQARFSLVFLWSKNFDVVMQSIWRVTSGFCSRNVSIIALSVTFLGVSLWRCTYSRELVNVTPNNGFKINRFFLVGFFFNDHLCL